MKCYCLILLTKKIEGNFKQGVCHISTWSILHIIFEPTEVLGFRERSFLKLGTGVEEFLEGCQIILPRLIRVSKIFAKITKYMMGCEIFGIYV